MQHRESQAKTRRSWWQFRLRTLLLLLTLISIGLALIGIPTAEYYREQQIVAPVEAAGGRVTRRFVPQFGSDALRHVIGNRPFLRVESIECTGGLPAESLPRLRQLRHLRSLTTSGATLTEEQVWDISRIQSLQYLNVSTAAISDSLLESLQTHPLLSRLNVARTPVSDAALLELEATLPQTPNLLRQRAVDELVALGSTIEPDDDPLAASFTRVRLRSPQPEDLRHLLQLPGLTHVHLAQVALTDKSISYLAQLGELQVLHIDGKLPDNSLERLTELRQLQSLDLESESVDDDDMQQIAKFQELRELRLRSSNLSGLELANLACLPYLQSLDLSGVPAIYDVDLEALGLLKTLQRLDITGARVTPAGIARLCAALPALQVHGPAPSRGHISLGPPAGDQDSPEQAAFWSGDYPELQRLLEAGGQPNDWRHRQWLGHVRGFNEDWSGAAAAYQQSLDLLAEACRGAQGTRDAESLAQQWARQVLLTGRTQLRLADDAAGAIKTLERGLPFAPAARGPIEELTAKAAKRITGLTGPQHALRSGERLWSDLMYPLTTQRELANAYEQCGDNRSALECWTRIRLCHLAYRAAMAETDALQLARLWASLADQEQLPPLPVFSVISGGEQVITLTPELAATRLTGWSDNGWNNFGLVPKPGFAIASLSLECTGDGPAPDRNLTCWAGGLEIHHPNSRALIQRQQAEVQADQVAVDVPFDCDVLFVGARAIRSITIRATLRPRTDADTISAAEPQRLLPETVVNQAGPFQPLDNAPHVPIRQTMGGTALAKLPDGRFLFARGDGEIEFWTSPDGVAWDGPVPFAHNAVFPTRNPALCSADDGTVWMVYLSKRPSYDIYASAPYYLYHTSSRDGRQWSQPKPIRVLHGLQYQEMPQLTQAPLGGFRLFVGAQVAVGTLPGGFLPAEPLYVPVRDFWSAQETQSVFDSQGRCHIVYGDNLGQLHYSYADPDGIWRVNQRLTAAWRQHVDTPQFVMSGDRLALLYMASDGLYLHRGRMTQDGPELGPPLQVLSHPLDARGARLLHAGDDVYIGLSAHPPLLLRASVQELVQE